ncbi:TPA: GHMP kinase [Candidatus Poribacteria bacterium]|nr:GHMP kinase [Candidatus Poribacteria bacterium]
MLIRSRTPVRIDFAGGWTDVALFAQDEPGAVINATINIYSYATVKKLPPKEIETNAYGYKHVESVEDRSIKIYSADFDIYQEADDIKQLEYDGNIDLAKAALRRTNIDYGVEIITRSNAPAGSGLGTSASMGVALVGVLNALNNASCLPHELAEQASAIERYELNILGGKQDHYASAIGGFNFMEFFGEDVKVFGLPISRNTLLELEKNLVLCYTGKSRLSGNIHQNVVDAFLSGDPETISALKNLKQITRDMKNVLLKGDLSEFARLMSENWENQKRLHSSVTNAQIDELFDIANRNGALGGKACGAGGGGCLIFYCESNKEHLVRKKLEEYGLKVIDFDFTTEGISIWHPEVEKSIIG